MEGDVNMWAQLIQNSPVSAALITLVVLFLRFLKESRDAEDKRASAFAETIKNQAETFSTALSQHGEADRKTAEELASRYEQRGERLASTVEANTRAMGEVRGVLLGRGIEAKSEDR